jgi:hypothetical protein
MPRAGKLGRGSSSRSTIVAPLAASIGVRSVTRNADARADVASKSNTRADVASKSNTNKKTNSKLIKLMYIIGSFAVSLVLGSLYNSPVFMGLIPLAVYLIILLSLYEIGTFDCFSNNENLVNQVLEEKFTNRDQINEENSYENKHLFEQKVYNMLKSDNKKKYLDLSTAAKDMFLSEVSLKNI